MFRTVASIVSSVVIAGLTFSPALAVESFVTEQFDVEGAVPTGWIASGSPSTPAVVSEESDSPEFALRLTEASMNEAGFVLYDEPLSTAQGLDITFHQAQFGAGGSGEADGIVFLLKDAKNSHDVPGGSGGGLGYINLPGAVLGVGLDAYGNFAPSTGVDSPCPGFDNSFTPNSIVVAGGQPKFCLLADPVSLPDSGKDPLVDGYSTRAESGREIRIVIDPVTAPDARVYVYYDGDLILDVALPSSMKSVANVKLGFSAGTGGSIDKHDIWGVGAEVADPTYEAPNLPTHEKKLAATGVDANIMGVVTVIAVSCLIGGTALMRRRFR